MKKAARQGAARGVHIQDSESLDTPRRPKIQADIPPDFDPDLNPILARHWFGVQSPFRGNREANLDFALRCLRDCLDRGEAPIASHLLYPRVLDDDDDEQRALGIAAGHAWISVADLVAVYDDLGYSPGMQAGVTAAYVAGLRKLTAAAVSTPTHPREIWTVCVCPRIYWGRRS